MSIQKKKILYIRNFASVVNPNTYNLQEIGLCKALAKRGISCDIVYYNGKNPSEQEIIYNNGIATVKIIWMPAFKIFSNAIYLYFLKRGNLEEYDWIITTEYNQLMTYFLSKLYKEKVVLYHGPYKDNNRKFIRFIYDLFFLPTIVKNVKYVFAKSKLASNYLVSKGFINVKILGVGLDVDNLSNGTVIDKKIEKLLHDLDKSSTVLYIGKLEERRNIKFLFKTFEKVCHEIGDSKLLIIGNGEIDDVERYLKYADELGISDRILHIPEVKQSELKLFYKKSALFLFPTTYDIFGMVLLESMYMGLPVLSSVNGGAVTLISDGTNGYILNEFNQNLWSEKISFLLKNAAIRDEIGSEAHRSIGNNWTWDSVATGLIDVFTKSLAEGNN